MGDVSVSKSVYGFVKGKTAILANGSQYSKAMLAKLRHCVGKEPESCPDVWDVLLDGLEEGLLSSNGVLTFAEEAIFTALTLYAVHQQGKSEQMDRGTDSFGAAIRKLIVPDGSNEASLKRRFDAIITAKDAPELAYYARGMVQMLRSEDIPLEYGKFAEDLYGFHFPETKNRIRLRWGEDFYRKKKANAVEKEN
jgi:CRISPR system Cascade subunit CasB